MSLSLSVISYSQVIYPRLSLSLAIFLKAPAILAGSDIIIIIIVVVIRSLSLGIQDERLFGIPFWCVERSYGVNVDGLGLVYY